MNAFSATCKAEVISILKCNGDSPHFPNSFFELFINENKKYSSAYTMGDLPLYYPTWTNAGPITTPPTVLVPWLQKLNSYKPTGIDPLEVAYFQNIFIDGSNRYSVEIWNLMDTHKRTLGWVAHAYNELIGCYDK
jgi:hypothetical protein